MAEEKKSDDSWMQKQWRPAMGWMYMIICMLDMAIFPVLWSLLQAVNHLPITQWNPLTLQGAGLFHIAMGAVLGIAAFGRTQEKIAGAATNAPAPMGVPSGISTATPAPTPTGFNPPAQTTSGFSPMGFGSVPSAVAKPTPAAFSAPAPILDPNDPPTRNTRND